MSVSSIHERFTDVVRRVPDEVAVSADGVSLTYQELQAAANRLAHRLRGLGVGRADPVAVQLQRTPNAVVAVLAALKCGAFYLPVHDSYPAERVQSIMDSAGVRVLLTDRATADRGLPSIEQVVVLGADPASAVAPSTDLGIRAGADQTAYLMFTSGSTGKPKGVAVTHGGVVGMVDDPAWATGHHDRLLSLAPFGFGVSTYELWVPLLRGGRLVIAPTDFDIASLRRWIAREGITGLHLTAGLFRILAHEDPTALAGVREVLTGGDLIPPTAVAAVLDACPELVVRTMYGATEVSSFAVTGTITAPYQAGASVPVGRAMRGVHTRILDEHLRPVEPGTQGELYIGGSRLASGYAGQPELTAERFVADPFADGERMYRTGDLFTENADGLLEFAGRAGDLVKIRGFRVELGEVESVLTKHREVTDVAVVARDAPSGDRQLVAYVVGSDVDIETVRAHCARTLPDYMVPAAYVVLAALPLTPNGKLDRRALPEPLVPEAVHVPPATARQASLCRIFGEVLDVERVGIEDSFFDLNGESLTAIKLVNRIQTELSVDLAVTDLFDAPTVSELDAALERQWYRGRRTG
ncbi:amino acid adenylation domain-containing protein [Actinophytocola sediminis]